MKTIIHTPTNKLENSLQFYLALGFKKVEHEEKSIVTDGKVWIEINPERTARAGIKMFGKDWSTMIKELEKRTTIIKENDGWFLTTHSNCRIHLVESEPYMNFKTGESFSILGNYAGVSLEEMDLLKAVDYWSILGFEVSMGGPEQGWLSMSNSESFTISMMKANSCPHLFFNPSMTYFNGGKNLPVIENIKKAGIPIQEEITVFNKEGIVDNVILRDPGGYGFFIFND